MENKTTNVAVDQEIIEKVKMLPVDKQNYILGYINALLNKRQMDAKGA